MSFDPDALRQFMSPLLYACVITGLGISNSRQRKEREVLLHTILRVAHSVAQITAKAAQNSPFRCSTMYRKLLICIRPGYYLANFKTARFDRSRTPPFPILSAGAIHRAICDTWEFRLLCFGAYATKTSHNSLPIRLRETTT